MNVANGESRTTLDPQATALEDPEAASPQSSLENNKVVHDADDAIKKVNGYPTFHTGPDRPTLSISPESRRAPYQTIGETSRVPFLIEGRNMLRRR